MTHGALIQGDVDDSVDLVWGGCGPKTCGVNLAAPRLLGFVATFRPTKGMGLAMSVPPRLVELLVEALKVPFQFGDAAITLLTAGTDRTRRRHDPFPRHRVNVEELFCGRLNPRCILIVRGRARGW